MTDAQRLDHVEDELETVKQLLVSTARYAESSDRKIDRLAERQDLTQRQLDSLAVTVQTMSEKVDSLTTKIDNFVETTTDFVETTKARNAVLDGVVLRLDESQARLEASHASTNAAVDRLERILEQLIRRNGGSSL
ncbi:hypothetical protein [Nostoc parmelioides]|uniref:Uncharacterized protein n=1 Tax=Nostoc parmelioides FACHB-3921 TaxID=2692909 RepID=A0ABR8BP27_9NOSO|nr:hypothetical protein [Nostoc parmelioides]MBD2255601.1 hypothetical protein [Nostoc parmelioides FACHB-3921]